LLIAGRQVATESTSISAATTTCAGKTVCQDGILLPMEDANRAVLETFEQEVLHPKVIEVGLRHGLDLLKPTEESVVPRREALQADLAVLDQELARFTSAVAQGGDLPALVEAIKVREERKRRLQEELAGLEGLQRVASIDLGQLQSELQARLSDWQDLLNRQVPVARQIIKKLLTGRIIFRQREDGTYEFSGQATLGRIIAGLACTKTVVAPYLKALRRQAFSYARCTPPSASALSGRPDRRSPLILTFVPDIADPFRRNHIFAVCAA
jgi:hypothetical protein